MPETRTILHVITGTNIGGAEFMLLRTIEHADRARFRHVVVCLKGRGDLAAPLESASANPLVSLDIRGPVTALRGLLRLCGLIRLHRPAAVQTWLAHATLFGSLASLLVGNPRILWCVHTGNQDRSRVKLPVRLINHLLGLLSRAAPKLIVSVSQAASGHCIRLGFPASKIRLIPNGTDTDAFRPDPAAGTELRVSLGIPAGAPVVGIVGRYTPEKDFATFFLAASQVQTVLQETHFLLCGKGLVASMPEAIQALPGAPSPERFHFLGARQDMWRVYNACRIVVLTSFSEAFPLVLGEAMACGVPVAATDVGDCRTLIGDAGLTSPAGEASSIAADWLRLLRLPPGEYRRLSELARRRMVEHYAMRPCIARYEQLYDVLAERRRACTPQPPDPSTAANAHPIT